MNTFKTGTLFLSVGLALAGCAPALVVKADDCSSTMWFKVGWHDGYSDYQSMLEKYRELCATVEIQPDMKLYAKGLDAGKSEKRRQDEWR